MLTWNDPSLQLRLSKRYDWLENPRSAKNTNPSRRKEAYPVHLTALACLKVRRLNYLPFRILLNAAVTPLQEKRASSPGRFPNLILLLLGTRLVIVMAKGRWSETFGWTLLLAQAQRYLQALLVRLLLVTV